MINTFAVMGRLYKLALSHKLVSLHRLGQHVRVYAPLAALKSEALMVTRLRYVVMHANLLAFAYVFTTRVFVTRISAMCFATTASNSYILNYDSTQERSQN